MEHSAQVDVLAQLIGRDKAQMVVALNTLAETVVGLTQQMQQMAQGQLEPPAAVYAPNDEDVEAP